MEKIKVLMIDSNSKDKELVSSTLSKLEYITFLGEVETIEDVNYSINEYYPNVILMGTNLDYDRYLLSKSISRENPDIGIIIIEKELKEDTMYRGIFSGAKDVIISPFTSSKLVDSIYRVNELLKEKSNIPKERNISEKRNKSRGHVITVFSTKGGVGKTFISTNLAIGLSKKTNKKVCLVDLDLDFGNTILALNVVPRFTISDIVDDIRNIDGNVIESYLLPHESGIKLLPANIKPQINEFINSDHIETILKALQEAFDYVIVDMPARFYEPINPAFQFADILLMVTTPEISTIRNIKSSILTLYQLNFPKSKLKVVLNKSDNKSGIKTKDVESTLSHSLYGEINADNKLATISLNNGNPLILYKPRSSISRSIFNLVKKIDSEFKEESIR